MLAILSTHPIQYQVPLWQALAKDGSVPFEVWYLSDHGTQPSFDKQFGQSFAWDLDVLSGYPHRFLKTNSGSDVSSFSKLRIAEPLAPLFREKAVSALWVQGWHVMAYWQAVWQAHRARVPVWLRGESNDLGTTPRWKLPVKNLALGEFFRRVDQFLYIGEANRRLYAKRGVKPEQLHAAPYCVDNDRFAAQADALRPQRSAIRREWNIPEDAFCVLFAGKFITKKRPMDLIRASRDPRLKGLGRPVHLLFVGSGELGSSLRDECNVVFDAERQQTSVVAHLNDLTNASFAGFLNQTEISKAYMAADCLVLPSDSGETWGLVVNEAMASGLPCIVSDACGCGEDLVAPVTPSFRYSLGDQKGLVLALLLANEDSGSPSVWKNQLNGYRISVTTETVSRLYSEAESPTCHRELRSSTVSVERA